MPDAHPGDFDAPPFEAARDLVSALEGRLADSGSVDNGDLVMAVASLFACARSLERRVLAVEARLGERRVADAAARLRAKGDERTRTDARVPRVLRAQAPGETFEQAKAALLSHDDAGIRTWMREEGLPRGERRMRMTWDACAGPSLTSTWHDAQARQGEHAEPTKTSPLATTPQSRRSRLSTSSTKTTTGPCRRCRRSSGSPARSARRRSLRRQPGPASPRLATTAS